MTTHTKRLHRNASMPAIVTCLLGISATVSQAIQLEWSSQVFSSIVDSNGNTLDPNNFVFELGSFYSGFNPEESNVKILRGPFAFHSGAVCVKTAPPWVSITP